MNKQIERKEVDVLAVMDSLIQQTSERGGSPSELLSQAKLAERALRHAAEMLCGERRKCKDEISAIMDRANILRRVIEREEKGA